MPWQHSCRVMCKNGSDQLIRILMQEKWNFYHIWIVMEKNFKQTAGLLVFSSTSVVKLTCLHSSSNAWFPLNKWRVPLGNFFPRWQDPLIKPSTSWRWVSELNTLRPRQMDAISQTTFPNALSWMKMFEFRLKFHWSLFLRFQLTIFQHWFRYWLGAAQATSHYLNQ